MVAAATVQMEATIVFQQNWNAINERMPDGSRKYRYIINTGSSRSSKTASLIQCFHLYAQSNHGKRLSVWRDTKKDCKDTVLKDIQKYFRLWPPCLGLIFNKTESIFTYGADSTIEICGTDDEEKVHGFNGDVLWLNEPYKISRDTFDQLDQRTAEFVVIDWNPKKAHFIESLSKDPRALVIHSTFRDNPFCPDEERRKILSYQTVAQCSIVRRSEAEARKLGLLTEPEAKAYDLDTNPAGFSDKQIKELRRCRANEDKHSASAFKFDVYGRGVKGERPNRVFHFEEIPDEEYKALSVPVYYGVDWGASDPWAIVEAKYYDGTLYLHELNYSCENEIKASMSGTERAQISGADEGIVTWMFRRLGIKPEADIICDTNRPTKIAALRSSGFIRAQGANKVAGSIRDGIDMLNNMPVKYTRSSTNLAYEQENYSFKVDKYGVVEEEPEDCDNHLCDALRYVRLHLHRMGIARKL